MDIALLVVRAVLAAVFAVAGAAKLADREGSRQAAAAFGVPPPLAGAVGIGLPFAELAVAVLLLPAATATWAAVGAFALLAAFSTAIGRSIARGEAPDCHCFGQLHSEPAGWRTLLRNLGLTAAAAFAVGAGWSDPGTSAVAWLGDLHGFQVFAVAAAAIALAAAAAWLGRRLRRSAESKDRGLPVGTPAPAFALRDVEGHEWTLDRLLSRGKPVLLVFTDTNCGPCDVLLPDIARWQAHDRVELTIAVLSAGTPADVEAKAEKHAVAIMLADPERATYYAYENAGTPGAILVGVDGRITRPLVVAAQGIHDLVEELTGVVIPALEIGREMPDVDLPALDGGRVPTASLRGYETVLLFWQPLTETCQALHKDIVAWEEQAVAEPRLVIVTFGEADDMRAEGFRSTVLLDAELALSPLLRGIGMPAAVLFDREGRVAWPLADGADHILRLLRSRSLGPPVREPLEMV